MFSIVSCTDCNVPKLFSMLKKGIINLGSTIGIDGKTYFVTSSFIDTSAKNAMGTVNKVYKLGNNEEFYLISRSVGNERGYYARYVKNNPVNGSEYRVDIGNSSFIKQPSGRYKQECEPGQYSITVTPEEIEAAIDYVKGKGSVENYTRLLRSYPVRAY